MKQFLKSLSQITAITLTFAVLTNTAAMAQANRNDVIKTTFATMLKASKGALGPNTYQTSDSRQLVYVNGQVLGAPSGNIFTAAFPTDDALKLAYLGFFVGNRFTTSYYFLHTKYVNPADGPRQAFHMDHSRFMNTPAMANDVRLVARHMILEQFYMSKVPNSKITLANLQRGTADANDEKKFYGYFVDYLAKNLSNLESDTLLQYELQKRFNLTGDSSEVSLSRLREDVAQIYDAVAGGNESTPHASDFRNIRNLIHNYMTPAVLPMIDSFLKNFDNKISSDLMNRIRNLRNNIQTYYRADKKSMATFSNKLPSPLKGNIQSVLATLKDKGNSSATLETLSQLMVNARNQFQSTRNFEINHWLLRANSFLQNELSSSAPESDWRIRARIALNSVYASNLISTNSYQSLYQRLQAPLDNQPASLKEVSQSLENVFVEAHQLAEQALEPAITDWKLVEKSTEGVLDDVLRSSLLTELNRIAVLLKQQIPAQNKNYTVENEGKGCGYLVYVPQGAPASLLNQLDKKSIPIFAELPLDLSVVAAIITEQPQTPLSHVSIKSKARKTPNLYYANASKEPLFSGLLQKKALVCMTLKADRIDLREVSLQEAEQFWTGTQNTTKVDIKADLSETRIRSTREFGTTDVITVGAKAANYAEITHVLPGVVLDGYGIPFFYYNEFIQKNLFDANITLAQRMAQIVQDPRTQTDRQWLVQSLEALQKRMVAADTQVNPVLVQQLNDFFATSYPGVNMRFRSSTNSEDLPTFSGAGLYDSYSYAPGSAKKTIPITLKKVWASVWNLRAFDEREHYGIPHLQVNMGVLVSPAFPDEISNGVAVTANFVQPQLGAGVYINTQIGEEAVTNPNPALVPEELLVLNTPDAANKLPFTLKYLKFSSLSPNAAALPPQEVIQLTTYLMQIHNHFKALIDPQNQNPKFSMDVEWKYSERNGQRRIFIKQARPYIAN